MAAGDTDIGTGTTIEFSTMLTTSVGEILSISWAGIERAAIDVSHMGTTGGRLFIPGDLYDPGEITAEMHLDSTNAPLITGATAAVTITFPDAHDWSAAAFMTGFEFTDPLEDKMTATATFKPTGSITFT
jgi:hypothetical protein